MHKLTSFIDLFVCHKIVRLDLNCKNKRRVFGSDWARQKIQININWVSAITLGLVPSGYIDSFEFVNWSHKYIHIYRIAYSITYALAIYRYLAKLNIDWQIAKCNVVASPSNLLSFIICTLYAKSYTIKTTCLLSLPASGKLVVMLLRSIFIHIDIYTII